MFYTARQVQVVLDYASLNRSLTRKGWKVTWREKVVCWDNGNMGSFLQKSFWARIKGSPSPVFLEYCWDTAKKKKKKNIRGMEYVNLPLAYLPIFWQPITGNLLIYSYIISRLTAIQQIFCPRNDLNSVSTCLYFCLLKGTTPMLLFSYCLKKVTKPAWMDCLTV